MIHKVSFDLTGGRSDLCGGVFRYQVLDRVRRAAARVEVAVLAFGFEGSVLRLVVEGRDADVGRLIRGVKVGTVRALRRWNVRLSSGGTERIRVAAGELQAAVAWAHRGPVEAGAEGVLASPWSSHRYVLGFRVAPFYDASVLAGRVDPDSIHAACGGKRLPQGWRPRAKRREDLATLLRVSGAVLGVLPADRRCFGLFVHLARERGYATREIAAALALTRRRIRQLKDTAVDGLDAALVSLSDPRLRHVP